MFRQPKARYTPRALTASFFSLSEQQQLVDKCVDIGRQDGGFFDCHNEKTKHMKVCRGGCIVIMHSLTSRRRRMDMVAKICVVVLVGCRVV